jgi:uncharacterized phage protein (TIGR01671 family)
MRTIKFRAWTGEKMTTPAAIGEYGEWYETGRDYENGRGDKEGLMQFTGLHDKNGVEIYSDDLLRIRGKMGNGSEYSFDAIYQVLLSTYEGLSIRFVKLTNEHPDSRENSYPINTNAGFGDSRLCTDYRNDKYDRLAMADHHYSDSGGKHHQDHHYTNDVEIIGNIYSNPELIQSKK